jgi:hypothetical protein
MARTKAVEKQGKALAYRRTSSAQNVGGDSDQRQRETIKRFARSHGYELVGEFYDAALTPYTNIDHSSPVDVHALLLVEAAPGHRGRVEVEQLGPGRLVEVDPLPQGHAPVHPR